MSVYLRGYQAFPALAIIGSVGDERGENIAVTMARQAGKNELSAWVEAKLLCGSASQPRTGIKCAPTAVPQAAISRDRLRTLLGRFGVVSWSKDAYVGVGRARMGFLSAEKNSNVVGHTCDLGLLECDEAQDVDREKWNKEFMPMGATVNATTVYYGTPWLEDDLLGEALATAKRVFRVPWWVVAEVSPKYGRFVERERDRLGANHPLFLTQYELQMLPGVGRLLSAAQVANILGSGHPHREAPAAGELYVAGLDVAGADEGAVIKGRDSTVLSIGRVVFDVDRKLPPVCEVVMTYEAKGTGHGELFPLLAGLLGRTWKVRLVSVDSTALGEAFGIWLERALGEDRVRNVRFTQASKSKLGYDLQASATTGRLRMWQNDDTPAYREIVHQLGALRAEYLPNRMVRWSVPDADGHDDYAVSLALLNDAADNCKRPLVARGRRPG